MARRREQQLSQSNVPPLMFNSTGGPVLGIVGLTGGAGATQLTYLIASIASAHSEAPVLAMDTGGPCAALDYFAGVASSLSLIRASNQVASNHTPVDPGLIVGSPFGARILSAGNEPDDVEWDPDAVARLVDFACAAHGLTVVDCGHLDREIEHQVLASCTHVAWLIPATAQGVAMAVRSLSNQRRSLDAREVLIARFVEEAERVVMSELSRAATARNMDLILMPHITDPQGQDPRLLEDQLGAVIEALVGLLR